MTECTLDGCETEVGRKSREEPGDELVDSFEPPRGALGIVNHGVWGVELAQRDESALRISFVEDALEVAAEESIDFSWGGHALRVMRALPG